MSHQDTRWDLKSNKLVQLFAKARATITGRAPSNSVNTAKCACGDE